MSMESLTIQKIEKLPDFLQKHLQEYIDFLYIRYAETSSDLELSDKGKMVLDARWEEHLQNKDKAKPWSQFKKELMENGKSL